MKLKRIKFLTGNQNLLLIIFAILFFSIFNVGFDGKTFKGVSGNFLIFNNLESNNYLSSEKITKNLEENAHHVIKKTIERRAHILSLENCKFFKKSDLITKINLMIEKNLGKISVSYQISPVEDAIKCKESISETIASRLRTLIDSELIKYNNEMRYIERLEITEFEKYNNELLRIENLEINMNKLLEVNDNNQKKITISEKLQMDEILFELKNRKVELKNIITILSDDENVSIVDEKFFELKNKKKRLSKIIKVLNDKKNIVIDELSSARELEPRIINFKFVGNALIIILLTFIYLIILFIKNKKII